MNWQINAGFIILGILLIAIFVREIRKTQSLCFNNIVLLGFGVWALVVGLVGLVGVVF